MAARKHFMNVLRAVNLLLALSLLVLVSSGDSFALNLATGKLAVDSLATDSLATDTPASDSPSGPSHEELVATADIQCEKTDITNCPSAVGALVIENHGQCTAWLVNENTVITNSHCVPKELKAAGSSCQGHLSVVFPANDERPGEAFACEEVVFAVDLPEDDQDGFMQMPDYAVLRLSKPTLRKPLSVSRSGLANGQKLKVIVVDPEPGTIDSDSLSPSLEDTQSTRVIGRVRTKTCQATYDSSLIPGFTHAHAPVAVFRGCHVTRGNSGAPALDEAGQVRALAFAVMPGDFLNGLNTTMKLYRRQHFNTLSVMANLACLELPAGLLSEPLAQECGRAPSTEADLESSVLNQARAEQPKALRESFEAWRDNERVVTERKALRFYLAELPTKTSKNGLPLSAPEIECVDLSAMKFSPEPDLADTSERSDLTVIRYELPVWSLVIDVDASLRYVLAPERVREIEAEVSFVSGDLQKAKLDNRESLKAHVKMRPKSPDGKGRAIEDQITLKICANQVSGEQR